MPWSGGFWECPEVEGADDGGVMALKVIALLTVVSVERKEGEVRAVGGTVPSPRVFLR